MGRGRGGRAARCGCPGCALPKSSSTAHITVILESYETWMVSQQMAVTCLRKGPFLIYPKPSPGLTAMPGRHRVWDPHFPGAQPLTASS